MIVYLDASAIVKRYVREAHSDEVSSLMASAEALATAGISAAEVPAALGKAARMGLLSRAGATASRRAFEEEWDHLIRLQVTEALLRRAGALAWEQELRGYEAVHLAAALLWRDALGQLVCLATYDRQLWQAAAAVGLTAWPTMLA